jgi:hypothetical protein
VRAKSKPSRRQSQGWLPDFPSLAELFLASRRSLADHNAAESLPQYCYEIVNEPVEDNATDYGLTQDDLNRIQEISQELHDKKPSRLVKRLEAMIEEYPQVPKLWNHLAIAYQSAGREQDYQRVVEETYRRFPDYLFGIINYAMLRLHEGHPEEIPTILRGTFVLHELQGGRMTFHISEVISFYGLLACYFLEIGDREKGARNLDAMEVLDPDHPMTVQVRSKMLLSLAEMMLGDDEPI